MVEERHGQVWPAGDSTVMKVLGIAGSLRQKSYNRGLLRAAGKIAPEGMEIEAFDLEPVPLYNQDVEDKATPEAVEELKAKMRGADGLLLVSPEYNHGTSGVMKNAIDWASRQPSAFDGKPVAVTGVSTGGWGSVRAQMQLKLLLPKLNTFIMPKPELAVANAGEKFDENGNLTDERTKEKLAEFLAAFGDWVRRLRA